jgi:hypothetical protein
MAVKPHEVIQQRTADLERSFYELLDVCDAYRSSVEQLLIDERGSASPREQLIHRLEQMSARISRITTILEDEALTEMLPILDRLFTLERAERGEDI